MTSLSSNQSAVLSSFQEITAVNANEILEKLLRCVETSVNLSSIERCDSAGIATLIEAKKLRSSMGKDVSFTNVPEQLFELAVFFKVKEYLFN